MLAKLATLEDGEVLCHGDFHPDQVILSPSGPRIIDWLTATTGNPAADVATTSLLMRIGALPQGRVSSLVVNSARDYAHNQYLAYYLKESKISRSEIESWQIPIATARLSFRIEPEKRKLEKLIKL